MTKLIALLRLMRLANIVTAISDILAGVAIAAFTMNIEWMNLQLIPVLLLVLSTIGLYGGGVVFNDVFDAELDKIERPERLIPSGLISKSSAASFAILLLIFAIIASALVHQEIFSFSFFLALATAIAAVVYDKWGKHQSFLGPLNMGLCRGLNLLLGMSLFPQALSQYWFISFVPIIYIAAITMISRGEVHGGKKTTMFGAILLYIIVIVSILTVSFFNRAYYTIVFLLLFGLLIFPPLLKALKEPKGPLIAKAVKAGVISLIVMNASWAAAFSAFYFALLILLLLPLSFWLAKAFAVT